MINQDCQVGIGTMICDFGNGDIHIGVDPMCNDKNKVAIVFSNGEKHEIGSEVPTEENTRAEIIMNFDNIKILEAIKTVIEKAVSVLNAKEKYMGNPETPEFAVDPKRVTVPPLFKSGNPSSTKIMECADNFNKTGKIDRDIVVSENLVLKDGYVGLLVARHYELDKLKVTAPNGIKIKVGDNVIVFKSNKIALSYRVGNNDGTMGTYLTLFNCGNTYNILVGSPTEAAEMLNKINKVFKAEFNIFGAGTLVAGLCVALESKGIDFRRV